MRRLGGALANVLLAVAASMSFCAMLEASALDTVRLALTASVLAATALASRRLAPAIPRVACASFALWGTWRLAPRVLEWSSGPFGEPADAAGWVLAVAPVLLTGVAAFVCVRHDAMLGLAGGLVGAAIGDVRLVVASTAVALVLGDARRWATLRERIPLAALGVLIGLTTRGLATDAAATLAPDDLHDLMRWWDPDPNGERIGRATLELGTLVAAVGFARGRTWGALALPTVAIPLAWCSVHFRGPLWGAGCIGFGHVLARTEWSTVLVPMTLAVLPWCNLLIPALARTVRAREAKAALLTE